MSNETELLVALDEFEGVQKCLRTHGGKQLLKYLRRHYCKEIVHENPHIMASRAGCRQLVDDLTVDSFQLKIDRCKIALEQLEITKKESA